MLYVLENGKLKAQPKTLTVGDKTHTMPTDSVLRENGYKNLSCDEMPTYTYYEALQKSYTEDDTTIYENYEVVAAANVAALYLAVKLDELNFALENGFEWEGLTVKLSESNQKDYLAAYALVVNQPTIYLPFQFTFKNNEKYIMTSIEEITNFTNSAMYFINVTLEAYRTEVTAMEGLSNEEVYLYVKDKQV